MLQGSSNKPSIHRPWERVEFPILAPPFDRLQPMETSSGQHGAEHLKIVEDLVVIGPGTDAAGLSPAEIVGILMKTVRYCDPQRSAWIQKFAAMVGCLDSRGKAEMLEDVLRQESICLRPLEVILERRARSQIKLVPIGRNPAFLNGVPRSQDDLHHPDYRPGPGA